MRPRARFRVAFFGSLAVAACSSGGDRTPGTSSEPVVTPRAVSLSVVHRDETRPTFTRVFANVAPPIDAKPGEDRTHAAVRAALRSVGAAQGLSRDVLETAFVENVQRFGKGAIVAQLGQRIDGIDVFLGGVSLLLDDAMRPVALSGSLVETIHPIGDASFDLDERNVAARALVAMTGLSVSPADVTIVPSSGNASGSYVRLGARLSAASKMMVHGARAKRVWFSGKGLHAAYYVELDVGRVTETDSKMHAFVVSARDGEILFRHDLTANDAFSYRVWAEPSGTFVPWAGPQGSAIFPHPTGVPDSTTVTPKDSVLVTLESAPFSKKDAWLGPAATVTEGNNVIAYADLVSPDGFSTGDIQPSTTGPLAFDRVYDMTKNPSETTGNTMAATTQLFYVGNWMHDWFYDSGFDELARNPQFANYGRGGLGGDPIKMESQDFSGRNNANASTPADGASPRIQMFLFNGTGKASITILDPTVIAGAMGTATASFGPANFDVTGSVVLVDDGVGTTSDACEQPLVNASTVKGKIALIDRGSCSFTEKVLAAEDAGAIGVIIANNVTGAAPGMGGTTGETVLTPSLSISLADGGTIKAQLSTGVTARLVRETALDRDGGIDTSVVSHEWGHVLSNRLIGNGNGLTNGQGGGMGEGWSDFIALMTLVRGSDIAAQDKVGFAGTYTIGGWTHGATGSGSYFGFRRYPYSADMTKNPLTFKHIQNGTKLPETAPISFGEAGTSNAEVHATGEVWASMLWQCYVGLLREKPRLDYEEATKRMKRYLVAGMKLTPKSPTIMEARDSLFAAMYAGDEADFRVCAKAFALRGAGTGAQGPARNSSNNVGVTESFIAGADFEIVSASIEEGETCDSDGNIDNGESATLTVKIRNVGIETLTATTGTLSSKSAALTFDGEGKLAIPPSKPFETVEVKTTVHLKGADPISKHEIEIALTDPTLAVPRTVTTTVPFTAEFDTVPDSAVIDTVEAPTTPWKTNGDKTLDNSVRWTRVKTLDETRWTILGNVNPSDEWFTSPPLQVAADQPFVIKFKHRYAFERDSRGRFLDGGVLEISVDGGTTFTDVGAKAGYGGTLRTTRSVNPLAGRNAWVDKNAKNPGFDDATVDLGTTYAGKTVQIRFRVGTDEGTASAPWEIDDIAFSGITNLPFASRVADVTPCEKEPEPPPDAGPPSEVGDAPPPNAEQSSGCGCTTVGGESGSFGALLALQGLLLLATKRRTRKN